MESLFGWLSDRAIGVLGLLMSVLSGLYAVHTHRQSRYPKRLLYDAGPTFALAKIYDSDATITMTYEDISTKAVFRTLVLVWNKGSTPIEHTDVLQPLHISWSAEAPVVKAGVLMKDAATIVEMKKSLDFVILDLRLVRASEACLLYLDSIHGPADLTRRFELKQTKSARTFNILDFLGSVSSLVYAAIMVTICIMMIGAVKFVRAFPELRITEPWSSLAVGAFLVIPIIAGVLTHFAVRRRLSATVRRFYDEEDQRIVRMFR